MSVATAFLSECSVVAAAVGLSDRDLTRCVAECAVRERHSLAGLLGFLAEFDARLTELQGGRELSHTSLGCGRSALTG